VSSGATVGIVVGVGIFLVLAGFVLLVINRLAPGRRPVGGGIGALAEPLIIVAGAACLIASVVVNGDHPSTETAASSSSPATPTAQTPTHPSSVNMTPSASPSKLRSSPASGPVSAITLSSPADGSQVKDCQVFTGTSQLAAGKTILLSVENLSDPTKTLYLAPVHDWQTPDVLGHWVGVQYVGSDDSSVGQSFTVDVVVLDLTQVQQAMSLPSNHPTWSAAALPPGAQVIKEITVTRIAGIRTCLSDLSCSDLAIL
jgi:hypothetical protein